MRWPPGRIRVAGTIALDAAEAARLPPALRRREALEARYAGLLDRLAARIDPVAHDPWPAHGTQSGASIALRLAPYRAVGGVPLVSAGEDRALFAALARRDARIRHTPAARVVVSCRLDGRAAGGMADTMRQRLADPDHPVDARLEAAIPALIRLRSRRALRLLRAGRPRLGDPQRLALGLGLAPGALARIIAAPSFGLAWEALQSAAPLLRRPRRLAATGLPAEIVRARMLLRALGPLSPAAAARPAGIGLSVPAG